jgi:membrane protease YdiL (CAAX protease family)
MHMERVIHRHPVLLYFALTFAVSWGAVIAIVGLSNFPLTPRSSSTLLPFVVMAMVIGPSASGLLLTAIGYGRDGLREIAMRFLKWRLDARWYFIALLTTPIMASIALIALVPRSPRFMPGIIVSDAKIQLILSALLAGVVAGVFEEIGWTGYAVPRLRRRYGVVRTGLIVGVLWGAWHYIVAVLGSGTESGEFSTLLFLPQIFFYVAVLPAYRVLMVWVYDRTQSLLVAMLMHASLTGFVLFILMPEETSGLLLLSWYTLFAALLWSVVAALAVTERNRRAALRRRAPALAI